MRLKHKVSRLNPLLLSGMLVMASGSILGFYSTYVLWSNSAYIEVGKNGCATRPAFEYFDRCNARFDSPACSYETQTNLAYWFAEFDLQCASKEDPRTFRFPVHKAPESLEVADNSG